MTSRTLDACRPLVPPFETAFQAHIAAWRLDGQPRTARRSTTAKHGPGPTPEDRRWCILVDLQTDPRPVVPGRLCGMGQSTAQQWLHVVFSVLQAPRRALGEAPTRSVTEVATRLGVTETDASALGVPGQAPPPPADRPTPAAAPAPTSPVVGLRAPPGAAGVPTIRRRRRAVIAARKRATPSTMCG